MFPAVGGEGVGTELVDGGLVARAWPLANPILVPVGWDGQRQRAMTLRVHPPPHRLRSRPGVPASLRFTRCTMHLNSWTWPPYWSSLRERFVAPACVGSGRCRHVTHRAALSARPRPAHPRPIPKSLSASSAMLRIAALLLADTARRDALGLGGGTCCLPLVTLDVRSGCHRFGVWTDSPPLDASSCSMCDTGECARSVLVRESVEQRRRCPCCARDVPTLHNGGLPM